MSPDMCILYFYRFLSVNVFTYTMYNVMLMRSLLFWDVLQRRFIVTDITYRIHLEGSSSLRTPIGCTETSITDYQSMPCNIPEQLRSCLHCGRSLKSQIMLLKHALDRTSLYINYSVMLQCKCQLLPRYRNSGPWYHLETPSRDLKAHKSCLVAPEIVNHMCFVFCCDMGMAVKSVYYVSMFKYLCCWHLVAVRLYGLMYLSHKLVLMYKNNMSILM